MRNLPGLALAILSVSVAARAQSPSGGIAGEVLSRFDLQQASVQALDFTAGPGGGVQFDVELDGAMRTVTLMPYALLADDYELLVDDGDRVLSVPPPTLEVLRGVVVGVPGSRTCATVVDGRGHALVSIGEDSWGIEPVPLDIGGATPTSHVVYGTSDVVPHPGAVCGGGVPLGVSVAPIGLDGPSVPRECEIAIDCDYGFYQRHGSSVSGAQAAAVSIMNGVDAIYDRDVDICYAVTAIVVRTTPTYTSGTNLGCGGSGLLQEVRTRWQQNHGSIQRDMVHLFSGLGSFFGTIGCAYNSAVCSSFGYGVSRTVSSNLTSNVRLVCHEAGHNWSAPHCDSQSPCRIMCSNLSGCSGGASFGSGSAASITSFRNSRSCLGTCSNCPTPAGYTYFGSPCVGSSVSLSHQGVPTLGGALQLNVAGAPSNSNAVLLWGQQATSLDLAPFGAPGCAVYVDGVFNAVVTSTNFAGSAVWNLQLPSDPGLCGMAFPQQVVIANPLGNPLQVAVSARGVLTFGV